MMLAFKQKRKIIIVYCILPFVILYNCITGREKKKRNILVYFLDCYLKKIVLGQHINVISITLYIKISMFVLYKNY